MTEHSELLPNVLYEDSFEVQMRGYSRRQVDEFVARSHSQTRGLEEQLAAALDESEQLRLQLSAAHKQPASKPPHEEISERIAQILKLAEDEARAQRTGANEEAAKLRGDAQREADAALADAHEKSERMLTLAQSKSEGLVSAARKEAEMTREAARAEAVQTAAKTRKEADELLSSARSQAERILGESAARATAINEGAARRLALLTGTHAEAARRLTEIRDVVTELLSRDSARGSLGDEALNPAAAMAGTAAESSGAHGPKQPTEGRITPKVAKSGNTPVTPTAVGQATPQAPAGTSAAGPQGRSAREGTQGRSGGGVSASSFGSGAPPVPTPLQPGSAAEHGPPNKADADHAIGLGRDRTAPTDSG